MAGTRRRVRRTRRGEFDLRLPEEERAILRALPEQLRELLQSTDPTVRRLFPPAYQDDAERNAEYEQLVRDDLLAGKLQALQIMEATIDARRISEDQLLAWLGALNDLRLTIGTRLDVTEDLDPERIPDTDPRAQLYALFFYLGWLEEQVVEELAAGVDPAGPERPLTGPGPLTSGGRS
jgi:hypothetical protein